MYRIVINTCFVFSLMMTFLVSPAVAIKTQGELLETLDLESSKVVLRVLHALRNNQKPDLSTELPPNIPDRVEKAQHIINVLSLFFNKKINKTTTVRCQFQRELQDEKLLAYRVFLNDWQEKKEWKHEQSQPSLEKSFNEAITSEIISEFELVEESDPQTSPIASTSIPSREETETDIVPTEIDRDILEVLSGFIVLEEEGEVIKSTVMPAVLAARLSDPELHPPLSLVAGPSTSTDTSPPAQVAMPSTSTDMSSTIATMSSTLRPIEHDTFLEVLDEKSAKIILESILNGYRIPSKKFTLKSKTNQDRYGKVAAYLLWILSNKEEKVLRQKAALNPDQPRYEFDSDWYDSKLKKYGNYRKKITSPDIPSGKSFFANILSRLTFIVPQLQTN